MNGLRRLSWICLSLMVVAGFVVTDAAAASGGEELTRGMLDETG